MVVKMSLYGLKSSGAVFRAKLESLLHDIGCTPSKADLDVWMTPEIKSYGTEYVFKLKEDKADPTNMYLGASLEQAETKGGTKCWSMSAKKYVKAAVINLEATLAKRDMQLPTSHYPMLTNYHPSEDVSNELNT